MENNGADKLRDLLRRSIDAGTNLSRLSRADFERIAREVVGPSIDLGRDRMEDAIDELRAFSRRGAEQVTSAVRAEIRREIENAARRRQLELADLVEKAATAFADMASAFAARGSRQGASRGDAPSSEEAPEPPVPSAGTRPRKATPAKKAAATARAAVSNAKKAAAKKAAAKKAATRSTPARSAGSSGATKATKASAATSRSRADAASAEKKPPATSTARRASGAAAPRRPGRQTD